MRIYQLAVLLFLFSNCGSNQSKELALKHLDQVISAGLPVKIEAERLNKDLIKYFLKIYQERESISSIEYQKLINDHVKFGSIYAKSRIKLNELPEFQDMTKLRNGMLNYIDEVKSFEEYTIPKILDISEDGVVTEQEINILQNFTIAIKRVKEVTADFDALQHQYYQEFGLKDDEINEIFEKYDL